MPSANAVAKLSTDSSTRLLASAQRIADATGVPMPNMAVGKAAGPEHLAALKLERIARWAEDLAAKVAPESEKPAEPESDPTSENAPAVDPEAPASEQKDLSELHLPELKDMARDAEIKGFSTMNKAELVEALSQKQGE